MRSRSLHLLVLGVFATAIIPSVVISDSKEDEPSSGSVSGVIVSGDDTPLTGVEVWLQSTRVPSGPGEIPATLSSTTDATGRFIFHNVPPGDYVLCELSIPSTKSKDFRQWLPERRVTLKPESHLDLGVLKILNIGATIVGEITCNGKPVASAEISVWLPESLSFLGEGTISDEHGKYKLSIPWIQDDDTNVYIRAVSMQYGYVVEHAILSPWTTETLNIRLPGRGGSVAASLTIEGGDMTDCLVWLYRRKSLMPYSELPPLRPDDDGNVLFEDVPAGEWDIYAAAQGFPTACQMGILVSPDKTTKVELSLSRVGTGSIHGDVRLLANGKPLVAPHHDSDLSIAMFLIPLAREECIRHPSFSMLSSDFTSFRIEGIRPGTYLLEMWEVKPNDVHMIWKRVRLLKRLPSVVVEPDEDRVIDFPKVELWDRFDMAKFAAWRANWSAKPEMMNRFQRLSSRIDQFGIAQVAEELKGKKDVSDDDIIQLKAMLECLDELKDAMREPEDVERFEEMIEGLKSLLGQWERK